VPRRAIEAADCHPLSGRRFAPGHQAAATDTSRQKLRFLRSVRLIRSLVRPPITRRTAPAFPQAPFPQRTVS
jgi:hypothetical protein